MLPDSLTTILEEIASMYHSDEYNLRVAAHAARGLLRSEFKLLPISVYNNLGTIIHFLSLYRNVDERLTFLYDKCVEWHNKFRPGPRFTENPVVYTGLGAPRSGQWIPDNDIRSIAALQGFEPDERECVVQNMGLEWEEIRNPIGLQVFVNKVGRKCIKTYPAPRPPRAGDKLWYLGLNTGGLGAPNRGNSLRILDVTHDGRGVRASDGHIYDAGSLLAIRSPWSPFTPSKRHPILWWERTR